MTDKSTIEDLRTLRRNLPSKWWYGSEILGILLDDLIERRETAEDFAAEWRRRYGDVLEPDDGPPADPVLFTSVTARDLLTDPTGDET